jgi:hypothetical protein
MAMRYSREKTMNMGVLIFYFKQFLILLSIIFFFYAAYQGVVEDGGSTSVFTGVGAIVLVLIGSFIIDKITQSY